MREFTLKSNLKLAGYLLLAALWAQGMGIAAMYAFADTPAVRNNVWYFVTIGLSVYAGVMRPFRLVPRKDAPRPFEISPEGDLIMVLPYFKFPAAAFPITIRLLDMISREERWSIVVEKPCGVRIPGPEKINDGNLMVVEMNFADGSQNRFPPDGMS